MKLLDIISEIGEELYKWDLEGAKKIIEKYKSINDFRTDYPKIYDAIRSRKLIPDLLDHLERGVSYKTGKPVKITGNVKYTEDELRKRAEKYDTIGDLKKYDNKAYESIRKQHRSLWDELQSSMDRKHKPKSEEELLSLANQYGDDFIKIEPKLYADAVRRRVIEPQRKRWTADEIQNIADNYVDLNKFIKEQNAAYQMAIKMGIKDDVIEHMRVRSRNLSFEDLQKMAEPFKHKIEFLRNDHSAYNKATREGWLDKLKEWIPLGNKEMRMVYVYEFRNKKGNPLAVYVGLTANENRRDKQHKNILVAPDKKLSPVYKYIVANNIQPTKKILSNGYIPYRDAIDMECYYQNDYYKKDKNEDGSLVWKPLHSLKCGGLGGLTRWTEEKIRKEASKYKTLRDFNKYSTGASQAAKRSGIYDDVIKNLFKKGDDKTNDFNQFLNGNKTDMSQLDLLNLETFYNRVTPENENKFLQRLKSVILKNKLSLSGKNNKNTLRFLNRRLYNGIVKHDKMNPNNKWVSYLFPNHVYGIGEEKLSFKNILKQL